MKIIFEQNGVCKVMTPFTNCGLTIEEVAQKDVPNGCSYEIVDDSFIPSDRTFRGAWVKGLGRVDVDMVKAKEIHRERIDYAAEKLAEKLTKLEMKADDEGDNALKQQIKDKRKAMRLAVKNIDLNSATTPEELKAIWPSEL